MIGFLLKIISYGVLIFGILGILLYMIDLIRFGLSKDGKGAPLLGGFSGVLNAFRPQTKMLSFQHGFYYASAPAIGLDYKALPILPLSLYHHCLHEGLPG